MTRFRTAALASLAALSAAAMSGAAVAGSCPRFEVSAVAPQGAPGAQVVEGPDGAAVAVSSPPLVSSRDVVDADVSSADGKTGLGVRVSAEASERVRSFTASHVGGHLAFIVDGRARMVLKILDPIQRDGFWISPMDEAAAKPFASALRDCTRDQAP